MIGTRCAVHTHREAVPIESHHVWPKGYRGPDIKENRVDLCGNGHGMVHYYMELTLKAWARGQKVQAKQRIMYGWRTKKLAEQGARRVLAQSMVA